MTVLYVSLGLAMISGITAMMQISNNINNMMILNTFKRDPYFKLELADKDKSILAFLENYEDNSDLCSYVKSKINDNLSDNEGFYEDGQIFLSTGTQTPSINSLFNDSCVLINNELKHRVLINKNRLDTYNLFSCYLKNESYCPYEINI